MDDFEKLKPTLHMLQFLSDDPFGVMKVQVERIIREKIAGAVLTDFRVTSDPHWITAVRTPEPDSKKAIVRRCGVAFEFELVFKEITDDAHTLKGVFTWVAVYLDEPAKAQGRMWFDVDVKLDKFGQEGELKKRMYYVP
jgi:hypothetical protein